MVDRSNFFFDFGVFLLKYTCLFPLNFQEKGFVPLILGCVLTGINYSYNHRLKKIKGSVIKFTHNYDKLRSCSKPQVSTINFYSMVITILYPL